LLIFSVAAFGLAWLSFGLAILAGDQRIPVPPTLFVTAGVLGPLVAAIGATAYESGRAGVGGLLARMFHWRVSPVWYAIALISPALYGLIAMLLGMAIGGPLPPVPVASFWRSLPLFVAVFIVLGVGEEVGWRGYAFAHLQPRYGALAASLIVGALHALWHLPLWFAPSVDLSSAPYPVYAIWVVACSVVWSWIYNGTRGSVLLVGLAHATANVVSMLWGNALLLLPQAARGADPRILQAVVVVGVAILVAVLTRPRTLTSRSHDEVRIRPIGG
jgi:membrane protease YdiL (CAAX protease family)